MLRKIFFLLFYFLPFLLLAQDSTLYSRDFTFQEGIYLNYRQFRSNKPIPKANIISKADKSQFGFIQDCLSEKKIFFQVSPTKIDSINTDSIWGFSENNAVYIRFLNDFYKLPVLGSFCRFVANVKEYEQNPMPGFYDPITGMYDPQQQVEVNTVRSFIFDVEKNHIYDFTEENVEILLKRDNDLYSEFMKLKRRQKKDACFIYLQRYNDKHPLYFLNP